MKATEWQELQRLLKVADQQGFVQEALVETGLASKEQLPLIPGQKFHACLKGETTPDWKGCLGPQMVVNPKMKAKPAPRPVVYKCGGGSRSDGLADGATGAMTDASKRRLDEGWEVMTAGVEEPIADSAEEDDEFQYQMAHGTPFMAAAQGDNPPMLEEERGHVIPVVNYDKVNRDVKIPKECKNAKDWGRTLITLPKWKNFRMSYEGLVTQALSGDDAACSYLEWLAKTYGAKYLTGPVRTQGPDLAGYVLHLDVEFPRREEPVEFRRQFV